MADHACNRCGACCRDMGTPPFLPDEKRDLPMTVRLICEAMYLTWPIRGEEEVPCYFWDTVMGCRIYPYRPSVCSNFVPGGEGCTQHPDGRR